MIRNYLLMSLRTFKKQPGYSLINLLGLAIGMACCLLILLFVQDELSFDQHHENKANLYRWRIEADVAGEKSEFALCPFAGPPAFAKDLPEIKAFARVINFGNSVFTVDDKSFDEEDVYGADSTYFDLFTHKFLAGDPKTALKEPGSGVITRSVAEKIFSGKSPDEIVGLSIETESLRQGSFKITGVIEDIPKNSHLRFNVMFSFTSFSPQTRAQYDQGWLNINGWAYALLENGVDPKSLEPKFKEIAETNTGDIARGAGLWIDYYLQKVTDIHLHSNLQGEVSPNGDMTYVLLFGAIAIFVLIIACINFMNLSTAKSANRAREVGLRKVFGAFRTNIINQFLSESVLLTLLSMLLALVFIAMALPYFNNIAGKEMAINALLNPEIIGGILFLIIFTGFIAGSYPAFFLSAFRPIVVLRGQLTKGSKGSGLRKALVVLQFSISIALITSTFIVVGQINYMKNMRLGFDKEQVLVVRVQDQVMHENREMIKQELLRNPKITNAAYSSIVPGRIGELRLGIPEGRQRSETTTINVARVDYEFLDTYRMELASGRNFSVEFPADTLFRYIINETAMKTFGWTPEEAVGKSFELLAGQEPQPGVIIGVIKDFHFRALREEISPMAMHFNNFGSSFASMKVLPQDLEETIKFVQNIWQENDPEHEFDYFFVDEDFASQYTSEEQLSEIFTLFSGLAILIACLGLFGLASFTAEQKTKEIGIRKALGASVGNITLQLSKEFVKWVLIANVIAWPVTYYVMTTYWLPNFPYKMNLGIFTFLLAGVASVVIALGTVMYQSVKAGLTNPVNALKCD